MIASPVEPHPEPPAVPPGPAVYLSRLFLVEVRTMLAPRLKLSLEAPLGTTAAPRLVFETAGTGATPVREPGSAGREVWVARLEPGQFHDGMNRVRLELPAGGPARGPGLALEFERSPAFPAVAAVEPELLCPTCCPASEVTGVVWDLYDHGQLFRARKEAERLRTRWPKCGAVLIAYAFTDFRLALESSQVGDLTLSFGTTVLGDEPEAVPPDWKLRDEAGERLNEAIRLYPGWQEPYYRFSRAAQAMRRWDVALRAARYGVTLRPADDRQWLELADAERGLLGASQEERARAGWSGNVEQALAHISRCIEMMATKREVGHRELLVQAHLLVRAGQREAARAVLQRLLAGKPEMREARALLASLGPPR